MMGLIFELLRLLKWLYFFILKIKKRGGEVSHSSLLFIIGAHHPLLGLIVLGHWVNNTHKNKPQPLSAAVVYKPKS